jgi:hypothetical protein
MARRKHPSPEMVRDLKEVFTKHNWAAAVSLTAPIGVRAASTDAGPDVCPDGSQPQVVWYQLPNGTWATKKVCA